MLPAFCDWLNRVDAALSMAIWFWIDFLEAGGFSLSPGAGADCFWVGVFCLVVADLVVALLLATALLKSCFIWFFFIKIALAILTI